MARRGAAHHTAALTTLTVTMDQQMPVNWLHTDHCLSGECCLSVECSSIICSFYTIAAAVPPRPEDGTVSVIILVTIVSRCLTDCNCNF